MRRLPSSPVFGSRQKATHAQVGQKWYSRLGPRTYVDVDPVVLISSPSLPYAQRPPQRLHEVQLHAVADSRAPEYFHVTLPQ